MAYALQWHIAHSGADPVVFATDRTHKSNAIDEGILLVICECRRGDRDDAQAASQLARRIFENFTCAPSAPSPPAKGAARNQTTTDENAKRLADAMLAGVRCTHAQSCNVIAAVVQSQRLLVARYGRGEAFLLRGGALEHLTAEDAFDAAFTFLGIAEGVGVALGELELQGEDRLLLSTASVRTALGPVQLRRVLRDQPSARRTAQALLHAVKYAQVDRAHGVAIIDFVSGRPGAFPRKPSAIPLLPAPAERMPIAVPRYARRRARRALSYAAVAGTLIIAGAIGAIATSSRGLAGVGNALGASPAHVASAATARAASPAGVDTSPPAVVPTHPPMYRSRPSALGETHQEASRRLPRTAPRVVAQGSMVQIQPELEVAMEIEATIVPRPPQRNAGVPFSGFGRSEGAATRPPAATPAPVQATAAATALAGASEKEKSLARVDIEPRTSTLTLGESVSLRAVVRNASGATVTTGGVRWEAADAADMLVMVDERTALFTPRAAGTYTIVATAANMRGRATVVVLVPLDNSGASVAVTVTQSLTASATMTESTSTIVTETISSTPAPSDEQPQSPTPTESAPATMPPTSEPLSTTLASPTPEPPQPTAPVSTTHPTLGATVESPQPAATAPPLNESPPATQP